jgi:hypothetical protein
MLNTTRFIPQEAMAALEATRDSSNCLLAELAELEDMLAFMLYKVKNEKEE